MKLESPLVASQRAAMINDARVQSSSLTTNALPHVGRNDKRTIRRAQHSHALLLDAGLNYSSRALQEAS
jgi:hypothetical protein